MKKSYFELSKTAQKNAILQVRELHRELNDIMDCMYYLVQYSFDKKGNIVQLY